MTFSFFLYGPFRDLEPEQFDGSDLLFPPPAGQKFENMRQAFRFIANAFFDLFRVVQLRKVQSVR